MKMPPRAVLMALAAAALFGASTPLAKALLGSVPPVLLAGLLYLGSGLGLMALYAARALRGGSLRGVERDGWSWLAGAILFGGVVAPVALVLGLQRTTGATAALLLNLEGLFTSALAWFVFKENFDRRVATGMVLIIAGGVVLVWPTHGATPLTTGALLVAAASACWAIDNNLTQRVSGGDPLFIAGMKGLGAGAVNVTIAQWLVPGWPDARLVAWSMLVGLVGYGASLVLFIVALRGLGTARTGAYFSLAPFIGAAVAIVVLGEPLTPALGIAAAAMGAGVWMHLTEKHEHTHRHEPATHTHSHVHDEHHQHAHAPGMTASEPHTHEHHHEALLHRHPHYPDLHHRHGH
jgi:drug/metabolite transporter (DMT)-like permease